MCPNGCNLSLRSKQGGFRGVLRSPKNLPQPLLEKEGGKKSNDLLGNGTSHSHGISKLAYTSSDNVFSEQTIVTNQDGTVIAISQTSESRAPPTRRGTFAGIVGFAVAGLIVVAFLYIGYLFLDAGTRGQFSWTLRIASIVAFGAICAVVALLRQRM